MTDVGPPFCPFGVDCLDRKNADHADHASSGPHVATLRVADVLQENKKEDEASRLDAALVAIMFELDMARSKGERDEKEC